MNDRSSGDPDPWPKRLNVGCGFDKRAGYLNVDLQPRHEPDLVADATHLPQLPSAYFDEILAQDVLEHFERTRTAPALAEWSRLLAPEGILHLRIPSLIDLLQLLASPQYRSLQGAEQIVQLLYGTQAYTGDYHLTGFTPALLDGYLRAAGLLVCRAALVDRWLFDIQARKSSVLADDGEFLHGAYFRILHRPADEAGLAFHLAALRRGAQREAIEASLESSDEARFLADHPSYLAAHRNEFDAKANAPSRLDAARSLIRRALRRGGARR